MKESNYRILRRRVVWLLGRWIGVKLSVELRPLIYETVNFLFRFFENIIYEKILAVHCLTLLLIIGSWFDGTN